MSLANQNELSHRHFIPSSTHFGKGQQISTSNGFYDVYRGKLHESNRTVQVLAQIWRLRVSQSASTDNSERFLKELSRALNDWRNCRHPNIVELIGISPPNEKMPVPALFYQDCTLGFVDHYVYNNPNCNKLKLILGVAKALQYLHSMNPPIIHRDVRAQNILVNGRGEGCLTNIGTIFTQNPYNLGSDKFDRESDAIDRLIRWVAPEILLCSTEEGEETVFTTACDVYGFGMATLEIYSGRRPFYNRTSARVSLDYLRQTHGIELERPNNIPDDIWRLIECCRAYRPSERPIMDEIVQEIEEMNRR